MNPLRETIEALRTEAQRLQEVEDKAHSDRIEINRKIGKLQTQAKKIAAIVGETKVEKDTPNRYSDEDYSKEIYVTGSNARPQG
jgi:hypothetical protein